MTERNISPEPAKIKRINIKEAAIINRGIETLEVMLNDMKNHGFTARFCVNRETITIGQDRGRDILIAMLNEEKRILWELGVDVEE